MEKTKRNRKNDWIAEKTGITVSAHELLGGTDIHLHEYYELELVLSGRGVQNLNGKTFPLGRGSFYLLTPLDFHSVRAENKMTVLNVSFLGRAISSDILKRFSPAKDNICLLSSFLTEKAEFLGKCLKEECESPDEFSLSSSKRLLDEMAVILLRNSKDRKSAVEKTERINSSFIYIYSHFKEPLSAEKVAAQSGYSAAYFSTLFKKVTGSDFTDFVSALRINYAKMLLCSTDKSVTEVALESGFDSVSNFFRCFKLQTGTSPHKFRQKNNGFY